MAQPLDFSLLMTQLEYYILAALDQHRKVTVQVGLDPFFSRVTVKIEARTGVLSECRRMTLAAATNGMRG